MSEKSINPRIDAILVGKAMPSDIFVSESLLHYFARKYAEAVSPQPAAVVLPEKKTYADAPDYIPGHDADAWAAIANDIIGETRCLNATTITVDELERLRNICAAAKAIPTEIWNYIADILDERAQIEGSGELQGISAMLIPALRDALLVQDTEFTAIHADILAQLRKDAGRYRWLRDNRNMRKSSRADLIMGLFFDELDTTIDAAMAEQEGKS
jgi:hypothetical protein